MERSIRRGENSILWAIKQISGVFVFLLIIVHIVVNHLVAPSGLLSYADVLAYLGNPWVAVMETLFLIFVCGHSLLGMRSIFLDLKPSATFNAWMDRLFWVVGIVAVGYGIWLTSVILAR